MPWENTEQYIRSGHRNTDEFQKDTLRTITLDAKAGIKAVIGKPKDKQAIEVLSYLFEKTKAGQLKKPNNGSKNTTTPLKNTSMQFCPSP